MRWVIGFGRFWWDFVVGDSIVLAIGGPGVLAVAYLLVRSGDAHMVQFVLPLAVIATLVVSLTWRAD